MNKIFTSLFLLSISSFIYAVDINEEEICEYNGSSLHDVSCSKKRFQAIDELLNIKYKELMSKLDTDVSNAPDRYKNLKSKYLHAQRAWIKFREKECAAFEVWYTGGSLKKSYYYACMKRMAKQRIVEFNHFANPGK